MPRLLSDHSLLDQGQIALLRDALGDADLRDMLSDLPEATRHGLDEIRIAIGAGEVAGVRRAAHTLKGVASSFGAARIAALASAMEFGTESIAWAVHHIGALEDAVDQTAIALGDVMQASAAP